METNSDKRHSQNQDSGNTRNPQNDRNQSENKRHQSENQRNQDPTRRRTEEE